MSIGVPSTKRSTGPITPVLNAFRIATNPFYPAAQVAHFDSILVIQHGPNARMVQCMKAYSLLSLGDEKQAVDILEMLNRPPAPRT